MNLAPKYFKRLPAVASLILFFAAFPCGFDAACAKTYEIGTGKLRKLELVPWESLQPGDTVLIYWRVEPYKEKFALSRQGKPDAPITIRGVPGPNGELPVQRPRAILYF